MADVEQRKTPEHRKDADHNLALDQLSVSRAPGEREDRQLEKTSFSFEVEKEPVSELGRKVKPERPSFKRDPKLDKILKQKRGQALTAPKWRWRGSGATILDKVMNFLADLLERLDRAVFRRGGAQPAEQLSLEEELTAVLPQTPDAAEARKAAKKRSRRERRLQIKRE